MDQRFFVPNSWAFGTCASTCTCGSGGNLTHNPLAASGEGCEARFGWQVARGGTLRRDAGCGMRLVRCGSRAGCRRIATRDENGCSYPIEATVAREAGGGKVDISGQIRSTPVTCGHEHEYSSGSEDLRVPAAAHGYHLRNSGQPAACHLRKHCKRFVTLRQPRATRAR
jgi:hypothetical protein